MLIQLKDFQRIHKTIYSILVNEGAEVTAACLYFSVFGACILSKHYGLEAVPVAGVAVYNLGPETKPLLFAEAVDGSFQSSRNAFHCWIEVDDWVVDFMSPLFGTMLRSRGVDVGIEAKMMQKRFNEMSSLDQLSKAGDFCLSGDEALTRILIRELSDKPANADLMNICADWYKRPPKKMRTSIAVGDGKGRVNEVKLSGVSVVGAW